jgi:cyclophilin family peptidyl-prolyl cis-trans isomerase
MNSVIRLSACLALLLGLTLAAPSGARGQVRDLGDPDAMAEACWLDEEADTSEGFPQWSEPPELVIDDSGETTYTATIETSEGNIAIDLLPAEAPETVNNFVCLATVGYYDDTVFHRVVPGFVIQGGDPTATGTGGPGYQFDDEPLERDYQTGTLAMANAGPDTNGSQFFIVLDGGADFLEPLYTIFGEVADGDSQDVVEEIGQTDPEEELIEIETIVIEREGGNDNGDDAGGEDEDEADDGEDGAENVAVEGDDYEGVIFDEAAAPGLVADLYGPGATDGLDFWTPDADDVEDLEGLIEEYLLEQADGGVLDPDVIDELPDYGRQYAGIVEAGHDRILANFFCDDLGIDVETETVAVEDGGACFFRVRFDLESDEFVDFDVNGEA